MQLTFSQRAAFKAAILANADSGLQAFVAAQNWDAVAVFYNAVESPDFIVWRTSVPVQDIYDQIAWANLTPADAPDTGTTQLERLTWQNRALLCQAKQFNLQIMLQGQNAMNASKQKVRNGLQDALTGVPSAAGGATQSAGWNNVLGILTRQATRVEHIYATGTGSLASPASLGPEGTVTAQQVSDAMGGL